MPDYFVPIDTTSYSEYYSKLFSKGIFNQYVLQYVDKNRELLKSDYPGFEAFKKGYIVSTDMLQELIAYAEEEGESRADELQRIAEAARYGHDKGLVINAGHGLHYENVKPIAAIPQVVELNIGHAIIARAVFDGLAGAVVEMKRLMLEGRQGDA